MMISENPHAQIMYAIELRTLKHYIVSLITGTYESAAKCLEQIEAICKDTHSEKLKDMYERCRVDYEKFLEEINSAERELGTQ